MDTTTSTTYWVCVDCYLTYHGVCETDAYDAPDREPLSAITGTQEVASGLLWSEHDCANAVDIDPWAGPVECDCETMEFSWSACDGCGSTLGGERHALTVWGE